MSTLLSSHVIDIEQGIPPHHTPTITTPTAGSGGDSVGESSDEESVQCSDEEEDTSSSECSSSCTSVVIMSVDEAVDLEQGGGGAAGGGGGEVAAVVEKKVSGSMLKGVERDCRICHLSLDGSCSDSGLPIELGCCCKDGLGVAHKHCAEAWFKIRGNKICEICVSTARNVVGVNEVEQTEQFYEANDAITNIPQPSPGESRCFWQGHKFLNFLLACMVFAFVISWLFHFNVPS